MGIAQSGAGTTLVVHFGRALGTQRKVMRGPQVRVHPQLAVDESRDGLD
ncbi:Uncharacterised protein [Mycobacterium tuberculosis]|uniref:Uncharacterized protein n=1 Tax=Mycobacterium tuberculosis TaxID=1773 RepID=A0A916LGK5_MYCTX|nr:Uncharacterised protein [Mycobacterium tuberculosis]COY64220.1 Uncharacterised protein [Mycobacterium tuberculosis]CPB20356.1 Uncharacterised protein [Mycobacterium tuberculosis]